MYTQGKKMAEMKKAEAENICEQDDIIENINEPIGMKGISKKDEN